MRPLNACMVAGTLDHSYIAGRNVTWYSHPGKCVAASYKIKYVIITQSSNFTLERVSQEEKKHTSHTYTHTHTCTKSAHNSFIHNSPKLERAQRCFNKLWYTNPMNSSSTVKRSKHLIHIAIWRNLKWIMSSEEKPVPKDYTLCVFIYTASVKGSILQMQDMLVARG